MTLKDIFITDSEIESESKGYPKPIAYKKHDYPIGGMEVRQFEILIYRLFQVIKQDLKKDTIKLIKTRYDSVHLCRGTKDGGRDIFLSLEGKNIGAIQCKKYNFSIDKPMAAKEIIKFCLNAVFEKEYIESKKDFDYYFVTANTFNDKAKKLLSNFRVNIFENKNELDKWIKEVIEINKEIKKKYIRSSHYNQLIKLLKKIRSFYLDSNSLIDYVETFDAEIVPRFFGIREVVIADKAINQINEQSEDVVSTVLFSLENGTIAIGEGFEDYLATLKEISIYENENKKKSFKVEIKEKKFCRKINNDIKSEKASVRANAKKVKKYLDDLQEEIRLKMIFLSNFVVGQGLYPNVKDMEIINQEIQKDLSNYTFFSKSIELSDLLKIIINSDADPSQNPLRFKDEYPFSVSPDLSSRDFTAFRIRLNNEELDSLRKSSEIVKFPSRKKFLEFREGGLLDLKVSGLPKQCILFKVLPGAVDRLYDSVISNKILEEKFTDWDIQDWSIALG